MEMKLKTLKDFPEDYWEGPEDILHEIRWEVIKQIKAGKFDPIKFLNITEEDLK